MLFKSLATAALVACAIAQPINHQHHQHEKKDVVTKTEVVVVTLGAGAVPTTVPVVTLAAAAEPTTVVANVVPSGTTSGSNAQSSGASDSSSNFSGAAKGITYSPYAADGTCKSADVVKSEVAALSAYEVIRLYGVDCNQVPNTLAGMTSGQKLFAGIFDMGNIAGDVATLTSAVKAAGGWDRVSTVSIGNELVNAGAATVSQIASYVQTGRSALTAAGYSGPVVSVDTFIAIINNPSLCEYSDYIAMNAHAFFDGYVAAEQAGDWVLLQIERVASVCSGKSVFVTETGWPTRGESNGVAVPSTSNQEAALSSISSKCGNDVLFFNAYNDLWKADGPFSAEKYWGVYSN